MTSRSTLIALGSAIAFAILPNAWAGAAEVAIDNFTFTPQTTTVKAGETVTFVNHDDIPHSVVGKGGAFRSKALDTNDTFTFTFDKAGEFAFFCGLHPHMTGKVVVTP
jgi:plastocyanin